MYLKDFYTWRGSVTGGSETALVLNWANAITAWAPLQVPPVTNIAQMITDMKNFFLTVDTPWNTYHTTWGSNSEDSADPTARFKKLLMGYLNVYEAYTYIKLMSQLPAPYTSDVNYSIKDCWPFNIDIDSQDPTSPSPRNDFRSFFLPWRHFLADSTAAGYGGANPCFTLTDDGAGTGTVSEANNVLSQIRDTLNNGYVSNAIPTTGTNNRRFVADSANYQDIYMLGWPLNGAPQTYSVPGNFQIMAGGGASGKDDLNYKRFNRRNILISGKALTLQPQTGVTETKTMDYMKNHMNFLDVFTYFGWTIVGINV